MRFVYVIWLLLFGFWSYSVGHLLGKKSCETQCKSKYDAVIRMYEKPQ